MPVGRRWTLAFRDEALEREYQKDLARVMRPQYRLVMPAVTVLWSSLFWIDPIMGETEASARAIATMRLAVGTPLLALCAAFRWPPARAFARGWELAAALAGVTVLGTIVLMAVVMPEPDRFDYRWGLIGFGMSVMGVHTLLLVRCLVASTVTLTVSAACVVACARWDTPHIVPTLIMWLTIASVAGALGSYHIERFRREAFAFARLLAAERARSERLLENVLPRSIAERLKGEERRIPEHFPDATVLFGDLVGFTPLAERLPPEALVNELDAIFSTFDEIAERHGLEKIKTIGDAYMVVGGVPSPRGDHAQAVAAMALEMRDAVAARTIADGRRLAIRIGTHTGPVVAGVIGKKKFIYDLWGDTVNTASRMESHGLENAVQVSEAAYERLRDAFALEPRGTVTVKGKGEMKTWILVGRRGAV